MMPNLRIAVNARYFQSIIPVASKEECRYYLNGIFFDTKNEQPALVATNGHIIACYSDHEGRHTGHSGIVPISRNLSTALTYAAQQKKLKKPAVKNWLVILGTGNLAHRHRLYLLEAKNEDTADVVIETAVAAMTEPSDSVLYEETFRFIDGNYPDWRRVIPEQCSKELSILSGKYIQLMAKIANGSIIVIGNGDGPNLVRSEDPGFLGAIMPMRKGVEKAIHQPEWIKGYKPTPEEKTGVEAA